MIGTSIGAYRITAKLGAGGMGEVYRARDTKLDRDVAIKILPESFAHDAERVARFEREAKVLAALNHPNIAQIYGLEERALVMELVEGPTLAERIAQGALPLDEALNIAKQIAEALEAAHEKGITHRDLKPANVKVRADGTVKVLDFGLATAAQSATVDGNPSISPTLTLDYAATRAGMIMGTAAYMSPEQASGKPVDKRSDIWSFGVVLWEMLTGKRLFEGETISHVMADVLKGEIDFGKFPKATPAAIRNLLRRCLDRDVKNRLRDVGEVRIVINNVGKEPEAATPVIPAPRYRLLPWIMAAVLGAIAVVVSFVHFRETPRAESVLNLSVALPPNADPGFVALSPDGQRLVVPGRGGLQLRSLDSDEFRSLPTPGEVRVPFWSADSRFIGFFAEGNLRTIPAVGGPATTLCGETGQGRGGTWNREGVILFASEDGKLRRVNASGGPCTEVKLDGGNTSVATPEFLPDDNHFFFAGNDPSSGGVYLAALDNPKTRKLLNDNSSVLYAPPASGKGPAHLLFLRDTMLMAQSWDPAKFETIGDPFAVVPQASYSFTAPQVAASVASNGTLIYIANRSRQRQLTWLDRSGKELGKIGAPGNVRGVALSPDGTVAAYSRTSPGDPSAALWLFDVARGSESRVAAVTTGATVWSRDGSRIVYSSSVGSQPTLFLRDANGGGQETPLLPPSANQRRASDWSRDGRFLVYTEIDPKTRADIWYLPDPGKPGSKPVKFLGTDAVESQGQLSPDAKWLAYYSDESGRQGVYIRPFPSGPGVWKISINSGREPRWSRDGKELFYAETKASSRSAVMTVPIHPDERGGLEIGAPQMLFEYQGLWGVVQNNVFGYSPHPDGKRFLVNMDADAAPLAINVVTNWQRLTMGHFR